MSTTPTSKHRKRFVRCVGSSEFSCVGTAYTRQWKAIKILIIDLILKEEQKSASVTL